MKYFINALIFLFPTLCESQVQKIFYDKDGARLAASKASEAVYYRIYTHQTEGGYYVEQRTVKEDSLSFTGYYLSSDTESKNGEFNFYSRGHIIYERPYINDKVDFTGRFTMYYYYPNGQLKLKETTIAGVIEMRESACYDANGKKIKFTPSQQFPERPKHWQKFLDKNLVYPEEARNNNVDGRVVVQFTIEPDGSLDSIKLVNSLGYGCDEEAMRLISLSSPWKPGMEDGIPVPVKFIQPIRFSYK